MRNKPQKEQEIFFTKKEYFSFLSGENTKQYPQERLKTAAGNPAARYEPYLCDRRDPHK